MKHVGLAVAAAVLISSGCGDQRLVQPQASGGPVALIVDGAHSGNANFFFLPPLAPDPSGSPNFDAGKFNPKLSPVVEICVLTGETCSGLVSRLTMTDGSWLDRVYLIPKLEAYVAFWRTEDLGLLASQFYRIRVLVGGTELGFADVDVIRSFRDLLDVDRSEFVPLLKSSTLPILFRIEEGALGAINPDHVEQTVGNVATIVTTNTGFAGASFPDTWLPLAAVAAGIQQVTVIIDRIPVNNATPGTSCLQSGLVEEQGCYRFRTDPDLHQFGVFNVPVVTGVCIELHDVLMSNAPYQLYRREESGARELAPLPSAPAPFLNCETFTPILPAPPRTGAIGSSHVLDLARAGWQGLLRGLWRLAQPTALHAVDLGAGGETDVFSFLGWARSVAMSKDLLTDNQIAVTGTKVSLDPRVCLVTTHPPVRPPAVSPPPLAGEPVTFSVTGGGGTVGGAGSTVVTTGADGCASAPWVLGPSFSVGGNTLTAAAAALPSPVQFSATGIIAPPFP